MNSRSHISWPVLVLFISSVGWGLTWWPIKMLSDRGLTGPMVVFLAFSAASIVLFPLLVKQWSCWKGRYPYLFLIALFGGFANLAFQTALYHGEVVRVMILFYLLPVWSVLGGRFFLHERIDAKRVLTLVMALSGAVLILGGFAIIDNPPSWIDLLAIGSGFAFAMNNLVFRATQSMPLGGKVSAMFTGCMLLMGAYLLAVPQPDNDIALDNTLWAFLYGIGWLAVITFGTQWGVTRIEAGRASIIIVMELLVAVFSAMLILQQPMSAMEWVGGVLVLVAAVLEGARED